MSGPIFSVQEQVDCVERELRFRRRVYARRIDAGQMTKRQSDREIGLMEAVLATVQAAEVKERLL